MEVGILLLIPLFPLMGTIINGLVSLATSHREKAAGLGLVGTVGCLAPSLSFLVSVWAFFQLRALDVGERVLTQSVFSWIAAGRLTVDLGFLFEGPPEGIEDFVLEVEGQTVNPRHDMVNSAFVDRVHEVGLKVIVWTVNDPGEIHNLIGMGVDGIISDHPERIPL